MQRAFLRILGNILVNYCREHLSILTIILTLLISCFLTLSVPFPDVGGANVNFYFLASFCCLKKFYEGL